MQYAVHAVSVFPDSAVVELWYTRFVTVHTEEWKGEKKDWLSDTLHPEPSFLDQMILDQGISPPTVSIYSNYVHIWQLMILDQGIGHRFRATITSKGNVTAHKESIQAELERIRQGLGNSTHRLLGVPPCASRLSV